MTLLAALFDQPLWLLTIAALWPMDLLLRRRARAREDSLEDALGARVHELAGAPNLRAQLRRRTASAVAIACLGVALAGPRFGRGSSRDATPALDILVCLDVSRSMRAQDVERDRLDYAHRALASLAARVRGERLGLIAYAGEARLVVPLTRDVDSFSFLAQRCDELSIERGGSDLTRALLEAGRVLERREDARERGAVVVVLGDGDDVGANALAAARRCGTRVDTIGIGSPLGSKIPLARDGAEAFLRDRQGRDVVTKLDVEGMRRLASSTGGSFVAASQERDPLALLYDSAWRDIGARAARGVESERAPRHWIFLALGFLALLTSFAPGRRILRASQTQVSSSSRMS